MTELSRAQAVAGRALRAAALLTSRSVVLQIAGFGGTIALAKIYAPDQYGFLAVMGGLLGMYSLVGNLGLGAAIVRNAQEPETKDYEAAFFVQLVTSVIFMIAVVFMAMPIAAAIFRETDLATPVRIAALALLGSALQAPGRVALERQLTYGPIVRAEIAEMVVFYLVAIVGGLMDYGALALAWALAARGAIGSLLIYPALGRVFLPRWHSHAIRQLLGFGIAFQGSSIVNTLREALTPVIIGAALGPSAAGYWGWSWGIAQLPLSILRELWRVSFPAFARLPRDQTIYRQATQAALVLVAPLIVPMALFWAAFGADLIPPIFGDRWLPALPISIMLVAGIAISGPLSVSTSGYVLVRAGAGHILMVQLAHTLTFWIVSALLWPSLGLTGFALGWICSSIVDGGLLYLFARSARPGLRPILLAAACALGGISVARLILFTAANSLPVLIIAIGIGYLCHLGLLLLTGRREIALVRRALSMTGYGSLQYDAKGH